MPRIDLATLEHAAAIAELVDSAYRGASGLRGWTTETHLIGGQRTDVEEVSELLTKPNAHFFLLWEDETLVACCLLERRETSAYFGMFAVSPLRQSKGYGARMLAHAETYAEQEWASEKMVMSVIKQRKELIAWYARKGFRDTGDTLAFPYGDERAGQPKRDDLIFLILEKPLSPTTAPPDSPR